MNRKTHRIEKKNALFKRIYRQKCCQERGYTMARRGENIYKRKDGRWEGRYIGCYDENHKAKYVYIYGKTYTEVKQKLAIERGRQKQHVPAEKKQITYGEVLD